jgi:glutamate N-acetyltransferase / amino-acid N-acetyltransferase
MLAPLELGLPPVEEVARIPAGFRAGAVAAGIKASGRLDLGVLAASEGGELTAAGVFTSNRVVAAPVEVSRAHLERTQGRCVAVVSTSGSANAATGEPGRQDQAELAAILAEALGVGPEQTLAISTGVIGTRLPVQRLRDPLRRLVGAELASGDEALAGLAEQMCTTDTRIKTATVSVDATPAAGRSKRITVSGVAKGVGMIHPRMATMLALVLTDATAEPALLREMLAAATAASWNQLTVDGDTSTNDTALLLASGAAGAPPVAAGSGEHAALSAAIAAVARSLARQQAADGEGATTLITCQVSGARDQHSARAAARAVVASNLVKAAVHGRDPNWGRIAAAVGNAQLDGRAVLDSPAGLQIAIAGQPVFAGQPLAFDRQALAGAMDAAELLIRVHLGDGDGIGEAFGCDLSEQYVVENSAYTT